MTTSPVRFLYRAQYLIDFPVHSFAFVDPSLLNCCTVDATTPSRCVSPRLSVALPFPPSARPPRPSVTHAALHPLSSCLLHDTLLLSSFSHLARHFVTLLFAVAGPAARHSCVVHPSESRPPLCAVVSAPSVASQTRTHIQKHVYLRINHLIVHEWGRAHARLGRHAWPRAGLELLSEKKKKCVQKYEFKRSGSNPLQRENNLQKEWPEGGSCC